MFVGAINATVRKFLASTAYVFNGATVVVGCSGNFTSEAVIARYAEPADIHSNDVSLYSCMAGRWLTGQPLEFEIAEPAFAWLEEFFDSDDRKLAALMVLLSALEHEKQNTKHRQRMWGNYREAFASLVDKTVERLQQTDAMISTFYAGDVFDHFRRFAGDPRAVFCCYAPTYSGGYERMYKRLDQIVRWDEPAYQLLDEARRNELLRWMGERRYLWYDDREIEGLRPVMEQQVGRQRTVYLYSNVVERPAFFVDRVPPGLPGLPLVGKETEITTRSQVWLHPIRTGDLARYKNAFLGKNIAFAEGMWAYAVVIDGLVAGFLEFGFNRTRNKPDEIYMMADFAAPGTRYRRLSKLIVALALSGQTRALLERASQYRKRFLFTTAFTDKAESMKYRGVLELVKRGETADGQKFLNYRAEFNNQSWREVLKEWMERHGSKR